MKFIKSGIAPVIILSVLISLQACKAKKLPTKPAEPTAATNTPPPVQPKPMPVAVAANKPVTPVAKPDYSFNNIQFEFDSSVLKTDSYSILDKAAAEMKMNPSVKFDLNGYASIEGTAAHNLVLSRDRANSVKAYLVNSGVTASSLTAKGFGTSDPIADNATESGKVLNRRVELRKEY